jgi:hypothetical protein
LFPDALGNPFPPYVNGSVLSLLDVERSDCVALGFSDLPPIIFEELEGLSSREKKVLRKNLQSLLKDLRASK